MNRQQKSLLASFVLHSLLIGSIYFVSSSFARQEAPVVIDFTVSSANSPANSLGKETAGKAMNTPSRKVADKRKEIKEKPRLAAHSEVERVQPKIPDRAPVSSTESMGPAAVRSERTVVSSTPSTQESKVAANGNGTAGSASVGKLAAGSYEGAGKSAEQLKNGYLKEHFAYIRDIIQKNISYPARARKMGWSGRVVVSFVIHENGRTTDEKIRESSGFAMLDDNVIATIKEVAPFPKPPVKAELRVPILYRLE